MAPPPKSKGTVHDAYRCALIKVLVFMTVFSAVVGMALLVYVIYDKFIYKEEVTRENLVKRYPGYFWTHGEYLHYSRLLNSSLKDTTVNEYFEKFCNLDCPRQQWYISNTSTRGRKKRDVGVISGGPIYHGCCLSETFYTAPPQHVNEDGVKRNLFHLLPDAQQFFKVSTCSENTKCSGCHCMYEEELHSAVVVKEGIAVSDATMDDLEIDVMTFNGCCKCVNDGT